MVANQRVCIKTNGQSYSGNWFTKILNQFLQGNFHNVLKALQEDVNYF